MYSMQTPRGSAARSTPRSSLYQTRSKFCTSSQDSQLSRSTQPTQVSFDTPSSETTDLSASSEIVETELRHPAYFLSPSLATETAESASLADLSLGESSSFVSSLDVDRKSETNLYR